MINKPLILLRDEFVDKIVNDINDSELPAFIIRPVIENVLNQVIALENKQRDYEEVRYKEELSKLDDKQVSSEDAQTSENSDIKE